MPSVDSHAHEGVDIDMRPVKPAGSPGAPPNISENTIGQLYNAGGVMKKRGNVEPFPPRVSQLPPPAAMQAGPEPKSWTIIPPQKPPQKPEEKPVEKSSGHRPRFEPGRGQAPRAAVKLRMTLPDFIRLRLAARDLETNCQALMLEAFECYLEANDIAPVSKEDMEQELHRLKEQMKSRRVS